MAALSDDELLKDSPYTLMVGDRLRRIRQQKQWSLSDVETQSESEFKASVLGAYERGERAISVPRLERLARFYGVSVDQLLPRDPQERDGSRSTSAALASVISAKCASVAGLIVEKVFSPSTKTPLMKSPYEGLIFTIEVDSGAGAYSKLMISQPSHSQGPSRRRFAISCVASRDR